MNTFPYINAEIFLSIMKDQGRNLMMPGNPRYQPKELQPYFGYDNLYWGTIMVEIANLQTLGEIGVISQETMALLTPEIIEKLLAIRTTDVDKVEREVTKHDIRALVRLMQEILPEPLRGFVHVPLTSYDALDTGRVLHYRYAWQNAIRPSLFRVISELTDLAEKHAATLQIGRTHKQHALPITVGFWLATIIQRLIYNAYQVESYYDDLVGKISGAVGAYNAQVGLDLLSKCGDSTYEEMVLDKLQLKPALISSQILPPEPLAYFLHSCAMLSAALGQFGRDGRNLMSSEIGEVAEGYEQGQVGSSTMAHKRNPINFENVEGTWLKNRSEFGKILDTLISDNQRDLVGSSVMRDFPIILINLQSQLNTLLRPDKNGKSFLSRLTVDMAACRNNFDTSAKLILAEPLYIALILAGYSGDAHKLVNDRIIARCKNSGISLIDGLIREAGEDQKLTAAIDKIPVETMQLLSCPEKYTGLAAEKTHFIVKEARKFIEYEW